MSGVEATGLGPGELCGVNIDFDMAFTGVLVLIGCLAALRACVSGLKFGLTPFTAPCTAGGGASPPAALAALVITL